MNDLSIKQKVFLTKSFYGKGKSDAAATRTSSVIVALQEVRSIRVIGLGYPKFKNGDMELRPYSLDINPVNLFFWDTLKIDVMQKIPNSFFQLDSNQQALNRVNRAATPCPHLRILPKFIRSKTTSFLLFW